MKKSYAKVDPSEIKQLDFDGTKLYNIRTDEVGDPEGPWFLVEPDPTSTLPSSNK